jgi:short-subunit dehydrogenase
MTRQLDGAVVVITGASSGIGRATALAFADKHAHLVLAARREWALREVAAECTAKGGSASVVPTDVASESDVQLLADHTLQQHGRIDIWVNNAGVSLYGRFEESPSDAYRRVIETNLFGCIHGARACIPVFYRQGEGVLINIASVQGKVPSPYVSSYVISKHGVRALGECLREEATLAGADNIHICTVLPATIDTPFFQHAANVTGRAIRAMPPVYPAKDVVDAILELAVNPKREVEVGTAGKMMDVQERLSPALTERMMTTYVDRKHLTDEPVPATLGNLFVPVDVGTDVSGGWRNDD